jgi:hypothetical protein
MALSDQIYLSRDSIRRQISDLIKEYLELENVDLTKSSFLSFIIDIVSTLTGNLLFYQVSTYREFFMTTAQLEESVLNLSAFLGYNPQDAQFSTANVLMAFPLTFTDPNVTFTIPEDFTLKTEDGIEFTTYYTVTVEVTNNTSATATLVEGNKRYTLPITISGGNLYFVLPVRQISNLEQEFQIDDDVQDFQFVTLDVPFDGQISTLTVQIQEPGSAGFTTWTEFNSLYLMSNTDEGYVARRTSSGIRLFFGNNLIGVQPEPGSTVLVTTGITQGAGGNVIAGTIRTGDRIYTTTLAGTVQVVDYTVTNTSPATNGEDEESIEEIRANSIASLTALNRLVSESDYQNISTIIPDSPFAANALPVLKRSDIKINEIQIFTNLLFGSETETVDNLVPTRNVTYTIDPSVTFIPRGTTITHRGVDYYTLFDLTIDLLNSAAEYDYTFLELELTPTLQTSYTSTFDIIATQLSIQKVGNSAIFELQYQSEESNASLATCELRNTITGSVKNMTNDATASVFTYTFNPYTNFPSDSQDLIFRIFDPSANIVADYQVDVTLRSSLDNFMISNTATAPDGSNIIIYDIPVIEQDYYDGVSKTDFESDVLQKVVSSIDLASRKMLTDFANVKFTNAFGKLTNMGLNETTKSNVIDILTSEPLSCNVGDRYILSSGENKNAIITCTDSTNVTFTYSQPNGDDIIYVTNQAAKYIFAEVGGWIPIPEYNIPLDVQIEVFRSSSYAGTFSALAQAVRSAVYETFKSRFGANATIYRSEIIDVVQEVDGVDHCRLIKPETGIFFNFQLEELTEDQLLLYGPEFVYFTEDNISVTII